MPTTPPTKPPPTKPTSSKPPPSKPTKQNVAHTPTKLQKPPPSKQAKAAADGGGSATPSRAEKAAVKALTAQPSVSRDVLPLRGAGVSITASTAAAAAAKETEAQGNRSYVTVLSGLADATDVQGVLALHASLRHTKAAYPLICLCVDVAEQTRTLLASIGVVVRAVPRIDVAALSDGNIEEGQRTDLALSRLHVLGLYDQQRVLFIDTDFLVVRNLDHLFALSCDFAFAPDVGVEFSAKRLRMINTGMFLHTPRRQTHEMVLKHRDVPGDGTGFLQSYINKNRHTLDERMRICDLDMTYNLQRKVYYHHPQLWNCMRPYVRAVHFSGLKPWHREENYDALFKLWWATLGGEKHEKREAVLTAAAPVKLPSAPVPGQVRDGSLRRQSRGPNGTMVPLQAVTGSGDFCINLLLAEGDFALSEQEVQEVPYMVAALLSLVVWALVLAYAVLRARRPSATAQQKRYRPVARVVPGAVGSGSPRLSPRSPKGSPQCAASPSMVLVAGR